MGPHSSRNKKLPSAELRQTYFKINITCFQSLARSHSLQFNELLSGTKMILLISYGERHLAEHDAIHLEVPNLQSK